MKKFALCIVSFVLFSASYAQKPSVENIQVGQEGDNIKITYRIGGSIEGHVYNVQLECSIDGGPRFEPRTVIGDVGQNIRGGKSYYTILWDVFEDMDEVGAAEFFIGVELVGGKEEKPEISERMQDLVPQKKSRPVLTDDNRTFMVAYSLSFSSYWGYSNPLGLSIGSLKNWGWYGSFRIGRDEFWDSFTGSVTAGATKRIVNLPKYRLHGYAGVGIGDYFDMFDVEFGVSNVISNRFVINFGFEYPWYLGTVIGIGVVF